MTHNYPAGATAIVAGSAPRRTKPSSHPEPFLSRMAKRGKEPLGDFRNFGVNLTGLEA